MFRPNTHHSIFGSKLFFQSFLIGIFCLLASTLAFSQPDSNRANLSFDFGITRGHNVNLWPFYKKFKSSEKKELQILFPILTKSIYYQSKSKHFQLLPVIIYDSSAKGVDNRLFSFYYPSVIHFQKQVLPDNHIKSFRFIELAPNISLLGVSRSKTGLFVENNIFFFIWYKKDFLSDRTRLTVFPAYWYFANKYESKNILLPLYWQKKQFNPLDTLSKSTIFPIYWSKASKFEHKNIVFPLLFSSSNSKYKSFTLLPLFSVGHTPDLKKQHLDFGFIFWHLKSPERLINVVFPVWWSNKKYNEHDTIITKSVFPIYWSVKSNQKNNLILFPLVFKLKDEYRSSISVFPLFSYKHWQKSNLSRFSITPLFWHFDHYNHEQQNILFPVYWNKKEISRYDTIRKNTLFPIYWSTKSKYKTNRVVFPIVFSFNNPNYKSFTLFPLFSVGRSPDFSKHHFNLLPIYWHSKTSQRAIDVVFPVWRSYQKYEAHDTIVKRTLFPLYWSKTSNNKSSQIVFPLFFSLNDQGYKSLTVLPLFSLGHSPNLTDHHFHIFPIYWHNKTNQHLTKLVLPLWFSNTKYDVYDTVSHKTLFPIYWMVKSKSKSNRIILPLAYSFKNKNRQSFTLFPLFAFGKTNWSESFIAVSPLFWHFNGYVDRNILFPIFWNSRENRKTDTLRKNTLFPIYWSSISKNKQNHILFPLLYSLKSDSYQSLTLFPLFSSGHSPDYSRQHSNLTLLYWHLKSKERLTDVVFPLWWSFTNYQKHDTICTEALFPIYWTVKSKSENNLILFPLIYKHHDKHKQSFSLFPLFFYGKTFGTKKHYLGITPLFWHTKNYDYTKNILFPIYWNSSLYRTTDTVKKHTLFPIYWSTKSKIMNYKIVFPLLFCSNDQVSKSITLFPLFSVGHFKNSVRKHLMISPIFVRFTNSEKTSVFLFPILQYSKTKDQTKTSILYFLFRKTKRLNFTKTSLLLPICERIKEPNNQSFRFAPIVWYKHTDSSKMSSFQPIYYSYKSPSRKSFVFCWFIYKHESRIGYSVVNSFLWKLFTIENYSNGDHETRFMHLVYADIQKQGKTEKSMLPFYHSVKNANGDQSKSIFFSFYSHFKQYNLDIKEFYEEERLFWFIRIRSNYNSIKNPDKAKYLKRK